MSTQFSSHRLTLVGCALAVTWLAAHCGTSRAALLAYEPFEYGDVAVPSEGQYRTGTAADEEAANATPGSNPNVLGGQDPTIGPTAFYSGPWIQSGGDSQVVKGLPSLSYPGFPTGIGGVQQETVLFDCCTFGRTGRAIAGGGLGGGRDPRTIYESFLINFGTQGTDNPDEFGKHGHELWNGGVGDEFLAVDLFLNHFASVNELSLAVTTVSGSTTVPVGGGGLDLDTLAAFNGGVHLVVMKYEFNPTDPDVVSVFLDPSNYDIEPASPDAQVSVATSDLFITHQGAYTQFTFSGSGHIPGAIDEIRWGDGYADVAPLTVPEPASFALLGLSFTSLLLARRKI